MQNRIDDRSMEHRCCHEQPRKAVSRQPPLVRRTSHPPDGPRPSSCSHIGSESPNGEDQQTGEGDVAEGVSKRGRVGIRGELTSATWGIRSSHPGDRSMPVPDRDAVQSTEYPFDRRKERGEDQRAGEQQDGFGAAQLAEEPAPRLSARTCGEPEHDVDGRDPHQQCDPGAP